MRVFLGIILGLTSLGASAKEFSPEAVTAEHIQSFLEHTGLQVETHGLFTVSRVEFLSKPGLLRTLGWDRGLNRDNTYRFDQYIQFDIEYRDSEGTVLTSRCFVVLDEDFNKAHFADKCHTINTVGTAYIESGITNQRPLKTNRVHEDGRVVLLSDFEEFTPSDLLDQ